MRIKLKLRVKLFMRNNNPYASITFIDIDDRFHTFSNSETLTYKSVKTGISIITSTWASFGELSTKSVTIPKVDRMGYELAQRFNTDKERYEYLKKLYLTLDEWSNYWDKFSTDSNSHIIVKNDMWEIIFK
jgi:hypothetical protein